MAQSSTGSKWVTTRTHLQISQSQVLPVIFRSKRVSNPTTSLMSQSGPAANHHTPSAFPPTELQFSDSLPVLQQWLLDHIERIYRIGSMNTKPGALETAQVLIESNRRFTVWFEPTHAYYSLLHPRESFYKDNHSDRRPSIEEDQGNESDFETYATTPQTLYVVAETTE